MNSCTVIIINESLARDDVRFAAKPTVELRAVPFGAMKKQIIKNAALFEQDVFSVFDAATNLPADIAGMAIFLTLSNSDGEVVQVKGKVDSDIKGMISFSYKPPSVGFYNYDISVKAANEYSQSLLSGSYVVQS
jgi:hypothetical protein